LEANTPSLYGEFLRAGLLIVWSIHTGAAGLIVRVSGSVVDPKVLLAETVKLNVPAVVGVPLIEPVPVDREIPGGSDPLANE
jgi:hypothetical protein